MKSMNKKLTVILTFLYLALFFANIVYVSADVSDVDLIIYSSIEELQESSLGDYYYFGEFEAEASIHMLYDREFYYVTIPQDGCEADRNVKKWYFDNEDGSAVTATYSVANIKLDFPLDLNTYTEKAPY